MPAADAAVAVTSNRASVEMSFFMAVLLEV
jgi:hypothetical protein